MHGRSMALEAGSLMHDVFGAVRVWQLDRVQHMPRHAQVTALKMYGAERWSKCLERMRVQPRGSREELMELAFGILHTSDWYDDENDRTRTMANMELASIAYIDERMPHMENWPIWVRDKHDPDAPVGIEQVFDIVLEYRDGKEYRFIGTIDGLVEHAETGEKFLDENKTANRLDRGWLQSFDMSYQLTGYCVASTLVFGFPVMRNRVTGLKLKPTNRGEDCIPIQPIERNEETVQHWARWFRHTAELFERYRDDFENAPRYTHSCNRYFRPCSLIPFCTDTAVGRRIQFTQEMIPADLSPSEKAILE